MSTDTSQDTAGRFCPQCGAPAEPGSRFCAKCGGSLDAAQAVSAAQVPPTYVAPSQGAWTTPAPQPTPPVAASKAAGGGKCLVYGIVGIVAAVVISCLGVVGYTFMNRDTLFGLAVEPTVTATVPVTATVVSTATSTVTPIPSSTATSSPTRTPTAKPSATPTAKPSSTATPKASTTPTVKPSVTVTRTPTGLPGAILRSDDFLSQTVTVANGWTLETGADVDYVWSPGKFTITVKKPDFLGYTWPDGKYTDFAAEVVAQPASSAAGDYGMVFRVSGTTGARNYYLFGVSTDGKYFVWAKVNGTWVDTDPVPATTSNQIRAAGNSLGVIAQGNQIALYINRVLVKTFTNSSVTAEGAVGIYAGTDASSSSYAAAFTRYVVMTPDRARAEWATAP